MEFLVILSILNIPLSLLAVFIIIKLLKDREHLEKELNKLTNDYIVNEKNKNYWFIRCQELAEELDNYENPIQWGLK